MYNKKLLNSTMVNEILNSNEVEPNFPSWK